MNLWSANPLSYFKTRSATAYQADANGVISNVAIGNDVADLVSSGAVPLAAHPSPNFRNLLDGADFTIAPWQRNVAGLASAGAIATPIANTATYFADRWFHIGGASSSITPSKVTDTAFPGFSTALKVQRTAANTDTTAIVTAQVLESVDCIRAQGQFMTFSILAKAGANFSGGTLTISIVGGTGANQSAANLAAGSWTGQTTLATLAVTPNLNYQRFAVSTASLVPATITEIGVLVTFTPTGTAGADDSFSMLMAQLELGSAASPWERRDVQVELEICQRYAWIVAEPASGVFVASGNMTSTTNASLIVPLPVQMWKAPAASVTLGTIKVAAAGTSYTPSALVGNATHIPTVIGLSATVAGGTAGQGVTLQGGGGSGYIVISADF